MNPAIAPLMLAYGFLFAQTELLIEAEKAYGYSCGDEKAYGQLMIIQNLIKRAGELGKHAEVNILKKPNEKASGLRPLVLGEAKGAVEAHARLKTAAERCKAYATKRAGETAHPVDGDSPWDTTLMHAGVNVITIGELRPEALLKLVEPPAAKP